MVEGHQGTQPEATLEALLAPTVVGPHRTVVATRRRDGQAMVVAVAGSSCEDAIDGTSVMYGASLTKQLVGVMVAQLVDEGLDVDVSVRVVLEGLPPWADAISLRHLLHHTSGLPPTSALLAHLGLTGEEDLDNAAVVGALAEQKRPAMPPGKRFDYSNVGYICLAEALSRLTHQAIAALAQQRLFDPFGMGRSHLGHPPAGMAVPPPAPPRTVGDGGLWTTADDLLCWNDAMNERCFGAEVHGRCETPGRLDDDTPLDYGWGVRVVDHYGERTVAHGGSWPGWRSKTVRQPGQGTSVALLSSCDDDLVVSATAFRIARWLTGPASSISS